MIALLLASLILPGASDVVIPPLAIVEMVCVSPKEISVGTAFRVGDGLLLSVNHVTSAAGQCFVDGKPLAIRYKAPHADFSMIGGGDGPHLKVDCGGFVKGRSYVAIGYARGLAQLTRVDLTGSGENDRGLAVLEGIFAVVPGQSGGPVIDVETGSVVGVVDAENYEEGLSWAVPLSSTPVCKGEA